MVYPQHHARSSKKDVYAMVDRNRAMIRHKECQQFAELAFARQWTVAEGCRSRCAVNAHARLTGAFNNDDSKHGTRSSHSKIFVSNGRHWVLFVSIISFDFVVECVV